uniref:Uncharacterized protein n=1 Tax=Sander lucioperca TaxID=283035 RepID=A0A8C9XK11_SANLU
SPCQVLSLRHMSHGGLHCGLVGKAMCRGAAPCPACDLGLRCSSLEVPEVDALVGRTAVKTQVQVLVITFLHRVHNFLRHPHSKGQVAAYLPDHYGCSNVPGLNLHMLPRNLLHHAQCVRSVPIPSVLGAICKCSWQLICLCVVHLLIHTFLEILKDDCQLQEDRKKKKERNAINV